MIIFLQKRIPEIKGDSFFGRIAMGDNLVNPENDAFDCSNLLVSLKYVETELPILSYNTNS